MTPGCDCRCCKRAFVTDWKPLPASPEGWNFRIVGETVEIQQPYSYNRVILAFEDLDAIMAEVSE